MRSVKSRDTSPEIQVRRFVHGLGYRFRLYRRDLPGTPDLVFPRLNCVIFVQGCFWHGHTCARGARIPKQNAEYWRAKIERNRVRDRRNITLLRSLGWQVLIVWECALRQRIMATERKIVLFLSRAQEAT